MTHNASARSQLESSANSGNRPNSATPISTPALNGTMAAIRLRMPVSQIPTTAPPQPTNAANAGGTSPDWNQIEVKLLL
ncbi:MAG: hypothetical protein WCB12_06760 [Bryobacteraceae bacterium]